MIQINLNGEHVKIKNDFLRLNVTMKKILRKILTSFLAFLIATINMPLQALALPQPPMPPAEAVFAQYPTSSNIGPRKLITPVRITTFSTSPSDLELSTARVFEDQLVPMSGAAVIGENEAIAAAIQTFRTRKDAENLEPFTSFLSKYSSSRWAPSLQVNLGLLKLRSGYLSEAAILWKSAWEKSKNETSLLQKSVADRAISEWVLLKARLGEMQEVEGIFAEISGRAFSGASEQSIKAARDGLKEMKTDVQKAFKCGPYALSSLLEIKNGKVKYEPKIDNFDSTVEGTSLLQMKSLADTVGLKLQLAKRSEGAKILVPSVMHWKMGGHFAAVTDVVGDRFEIKDPTFGNCGTFRVKQDVFDKETDGYALVPDGTLPSGWQAVSENDAKNVMGKGAAWYFPANFQGGSGTPPTWCPPMAVFDVDQTSMDLKMSDTPLYFECPIGGRVNFTVKYVSSLPNYPSVDSFTRVGTNFTFNWLSFLTVDGASTAIVRTKEGYEETYIQSAGVYTRDKLSQALLVNMGGGVYQRQLSDGSVEIFDLSDGATPAKLFMTKYRNPQGNEYLVQYDANFRITSVIDPVGEISTLSYISNTVGNSGFYKVSQITEPFGRTCSFVYDSTNTYLLTITDLIGLQSKFIYDTSTAFITSLNTAYGTTSFSQYVPTASITSRGLAIQYPDGSRQVMETWLGHGYDVTYIWDREATERYPNDPGNHDFSHCKQVGWLWALSGMLFPMVDFIKPPLQNQTKYIYLDEVFDAKNRGRVGTNTINKPISVSTVASSPVKMTLGGTKTTGDVLTLTFTDAAFPSGVQSVSYTVLAGDSLTSITTGLAAAVKGNSALSSLGVVAAPLGTALTVVSQSANQTSYSYSKSGGATETIILASVSPQTAQITVTGSLSSPQNLSIGLNAQGVSMGAAGYNTIVGDTPTSIATALKNAINASSVFTNRGVTATSYGPTIFFSTSNSDNITYQMYASGTLDLRVDYQSPSGAITSTYQNNTLGHRTFSVDPNGRVMTYTYAANGIDLTQITEIQNNDSYMLGNWTYNSQHLPTQFIDGSARQWSYAYNSSGQMISQTDPNSNSTTLTYSGTTTATIGGTKTTGNILTITVFDAGLSGGQKAINYTVLVGDTLTTIASGLAAAISADASLQAIGVSASSASTVITLASNSTNVTSYTKSLSGGSTETITLGASKFGFLTKVNGPLSGSSDITTFSYDGYNRLATTTDSEGYQLSFNYDNGDRQVQTTYPDATTEKTIYDRLDAIFSKDRIGRWSQSAFDSLERLVFEMDPLGRKTQYGWCNCGSMKKLTDPVGNVTQWNHDLQGRKIQKVYANQTTVNYSYEPGAGRMFSRTDALNQTTNYFLNLDGTTYGTAYFNAVNPTSNVISSYDPRFSRISSVQNDWGTISYTYNNYVTSAGATPILGGGKLALVHNDVIANSDITYSFDALGRTTNRSINGSINSIDWSYDAMSRVTSETNALGAFAYAYIDDTPGSSKGETRLASVTYPNSQVTNYDWYGNTDDQRLKTINNLNPSGNTLSRFDYRYNPAGEISQWQQQQNGGNDFHNLNYDSASQLISDKVGSGAPGAPYSKEFHYAYDFAANRTDVQSHSVDTLRIGGTVTTGNILTVTVKDSALSGGQQAVSYTVIGGDSLASIAQGLTTNLNTNTNLQAIGVVANAQSGKTLVNLRSASSNITTFSSSTSGGATATMAFGIWRNGLWNAVIGGTKTTGNVLTITVKDAALSGGNKAISYTVLSGDSLSTIATGIKNAINADATLAALGVTATSVGTSISMASNSKNVTSYTQSVSGGSTETIALSINQNSLQTATIAGTKTTGNTVTLNVYDMALAGGVRAVTYTTLAGDTLTTIATGLTSAINADVNLQAIAMSATSSGTVVTLQSKSPNLTSYRATTSAAATTTITLSEPVNSWVIAALNGTKTTGNVLTITAYDAALAGGSRAVSYTVLAGDTISTIATGLASAINADVNLQAIGVSAVANGTVVSLKSTSPNLTTYLQSTSSGATANIAMSSSTSIVKSTVNNVNELISLSPGGKARFQGTTSKPVKSASVAGQVITILQKALSAINFETSLKGTATETVTFGPVVDGNTTATIGGTATTGDKVSLTVNDVRIATGPITASYVVKSGDTTTAIATGLKNALNATALQSIYYFNITSTGAVISIQGYLDYEDAVYSSSVDGVATENLSLSTNVNGNVSLTVGGTPKTNDLVYLNIENSSLPGGEKTVSYMVASGDTTTNIATGLKNAINSDTNLQAIGISAASSAAVISIFSAGTTYSTSTSGGATVTLTAGVNANGNVSIAVGGKVTTGNTATITVFNSALPSGQQALTYTVGAVDTLVDIANGLTSLINASANLQSLGVTAKNSETADLAFSQSFAGSGTLLSGVSLVNIQATDSVPTTKTNVNSLNITPSATSTHTWDANGNMTSDGTNSYKWDAMNRLIEIDYPGSNLTEFTFDSLGRNVKLVETVSGSITSTKQFVWCGNNRCEERNGSNNVVSQFFAGGQKSTGTSYIFVKDHPGSIREVTDSSGFVQAQYSFDPYGRVTKLQGGLDVDFRYAGYYFHQRSALSMTRTRAYDSRFGKWINRDPIQEFGGINLYQYCGNTPVLLTDPSGLFAFSSKICCEVRNKLKQLAEQSMSNNKEMGSPFNIDAKGNVTFGNDITGATWQGPISSVRGYSNIGMTHVLGGMGGSYTVFGQTITIPNNFAAPSGPNSGFNPGQGDFGSSDVTAWATNDSGGIFAMENGHLYEMSPDCKDCWDRGTWGASFQSGVKPCP